MSWLWCSIAVEPRARACLHPVLSCDGGGCITVVARDQGRSADERCSSWLGTDADPVVVWRGVTAYRAAGMLYLDQVSGSDAVDASPSILVAGRWDFLALGR